jgi:hypothetical protein
MLAIAKATFLFLLLLWDWMEDPYQGRSPFSQRLGSQIAICHSLADRAEVLQSTTRDLFHHLGPSTLDWLLAPLSPGLNLIEDRWLAVPPPDLLYQFMSLQR